MTTPTRSLVKSVITGLDPLPRDPSLVRVAIDGEEAGTLLRETAERLRLRLGGAITKATFTKLSEAIEVAAARNAALRLLARSDRSRAVLVAQLVSRGHAEGCVESAVARLAEDGWIDDERYAGIRARGLAERRSVAHEFVEAALTNDGIPEPVARKAASASAPRSGDAERAEALARRLRQRSARPDKKSVARIAQGLARAGFNADTITAALTTVLGRATARLWEPSLED